MQVVSERAVLAAWSSLSKAKTAIDRVKLAQQLLNVVGGGGGPGSTGQQGMLGGTLVGQGSGGLTGNMKMMLQANAQAQMNGQPLPFLVWAAWGDRWPIPSPIRKRPTIS